MFRSSSSLNSFTLTAIVRAVVGAAFILIPARFNAVKRPFAQAAKSWQSFCLVTRKIYKLRTPLG